MPTSPRQSPDEAEALVMIRSLRYGSSHLQVMAELESFLEQEREALRQGGPRSDWRSQMQAERRAWELDARRAARPPARAVRDADPSPPRAPASNTAEAEAARQAEERLLERERRELEETQRQLERLEAQLREEREAQRRARELEEQAERVRSEEQPAPEAEVSDPRREADEERERHVQLLALQKRLREEEARRVEMELALEEERAAQRLREEGARREEARRAALEAEVQAERDRSSAELEALRHELERYQAGVSAQLQERMALELEAAAAKRAAALAEEERARREAVERQLAEQRLQRLEAEARAKVEAEARALLERKQHEERDRLEAEEHARRAAELKMLEEMSQLRKELADRLAAHELLVQQQLREEGLRLAEQAAQLAAEEQRRRLEAERIAQNVEERRLKQEADQWRHTRVASDPAPADDRTRRERQRQAEDEQQRWQELQQRELQARQRMQATLWHCFARMPLSLGSLLKFKAHFLRLDTDGSGLLGVQQMRRMVEGLGIPNVSQAQLQGMIRQADHNGDGLIDWWEFCSIMAFITLGLGPSLDPREFLGYCHQTFDQHQRCAYDESLYCQRS